MADSQQRSQSPTPPGPLPIRRLDETLINRIAAGEIIHRPSSALKELLENALDAGATSIRITVKDGGMKLLQIQDNGHGIRKADLPLLATRFATSKLSDFSDLSRLQTYGFRGEALASISHVAHLSVITKTKSDSCAWKAHYMDGVLAPPKPGFSADPKPCAGNDGTTITVENLFFNTPTRLAALRSTSDEYGRILDVVSRYAVHNPAVSFVCKKAGSANADISTPQASTVQHTIGILYGNSIKKELIGVTASPATAGKGTRSQRKEKQDAEEDEEDQEDEGEDQDQDEDEDMEVKNPDPSSTLNTWSAQVYITSSHYQARKTTFLLFINHRLVDSPRFKRALETAYIGSLPKHACPFIYLSLLLPPHTVDVNVHPTKREVHFLDEDAIVEAVADEVQKALLKGEKARTRTFEYQTLLTSAFDEAPTQPSKKDKGKGKANPADDMDIDEDDEKEEEPAETVAKQKKVLSQHKVRTSTKDRTLDEMLPARPSRTSINHGDKPSGAGTPVGTPLVGIKDKPISETDCDLTSIIALREEVVKARHNELTKIIQEAVFVGIVDLHRCLSLIQHAKRLLLVNHAALAEEFFYQLALRQFGNLGHIKLNPPPSLRSLLKIAVAAEDTSASPLDKRQLVEIIFNKIMAGRQLFQEYFNMEITADGKVNSIPRLLRQYTPDLDRLPLFLMRIGPQVDWSDETECFRTFMRELAYFYVPGPLPFETVAKGQHTDTSIRNSEDDRRFQLDSDESKQERWQIQYVLFAAMRKYFVAPKKALDSDVTQVASLPDLYRVFERC